MRITQVIGKVTLSRCHSSVQGAAWRIAVPLNEAGLRGDARGRGEEFVVYDELNSGDGALIGVSEGAEAAAPFAPEVKPIDAYNSAILDTIELEPTE
jgi:ethanolamine utilization protein EutN